MQVVCGKAAASSLYPSVSRDLPAVDHLGDSLEGGEDAAAGGGRGAPPPPSWQDMYDSGNLGQVRAVTATLLSHSLQTLRSVCRRACLVSMRPTQHEP
jgi:hypothetical protein